MYLTKYGDDSARKPILDRYLQWSEKWSNTPAGSQADDDDPRSDLSSPEFSPEIAKQRQDFQLGATLASALLANQGWLPDADLTDTVLQHCVGEAMCDEVKRLSSPKLTLTVFHLPRSFSHQDEYILGPYNPPTLALLEAKLDQYPKGTVFTLDHASSSSAESEQTKLEAGMHVLFAKHGMVLTLPNQ